MDFSAKYRQLITSQRQYTSTSKLSETLSGSTASDRSRVLYSAPFRRQQVRLQHIGRVFDVYQVRRVEHRRTHDKQHVRQPVAQIRQRRIFRRVVLRNSLIDNEVDQLRAFLTAQTLYVTLEPLHGRRARGPLAGWHGTQHEGERAACGACCTGARRGSSELGDNIAYAVLGTIVLCSICHSSSWTAMADQRRTAAIGSA